ncbi:MAG: type IV toxin-antitoxin system AbiEi family antitoxin [Pseudonocardia sp.]
MAEAVARVPSVLVRRGRVLRPVDAQGVYAYPRPEFQRLERAGALHLLATGLYAVVPDDQVGLPWLPGLEAVALGIAGVGRHTDGAALMGISAARIHGALARAVGVATVAVQRHRRPLQLADRDALVLFVRRDVAVLDLQHHRTELGNGWVTTVEQTLLDLIARPMLGDVPDAADDAATALLPRADTDLLHDLARAQRRRAAVDQFLAAGR